MKLPVTKLMIFIRHLRLNKGPGMYKQVDGELIVESKIPMSYFLPGKYPIKVKMAREQFALCLVPLGQNKFMPGSVWDHE